MQKVSHPDAFFHIFIAVDRRNASAGRAEFFVLQTLLFHPVQSYMIGHTDMSLITDFQIFRGNLHTGVGEPFHFFDQVFNIDDHSVAHNADDFLPQNA